MSPGKRPRSMRRRSSRAVPRSPTARATTSRGASSSVNRWPSASTSTAPSPRSASLSRSPFSASTVGWNCMNSRSASRAPARKAMAMPSPVAPGGFVVRCQSDAAPPVATSVARASIVRRSVTTRSNDLPRPRSRARSPLRRRECAGARARGRRARGGSPCRWRHRRRGARGAASAHLRAPARDRTARPAQPRSATLRRRLPDQLADGALAAEAAPGAHRVLRVQLRDCRRHAIAAATPPWAR